jgi:hypothetical protein
LSTGYAWRFSQGQLKRISLDVEGSLKHDSHGQLTGYSLGFMPWTEFLAQFSIHGRIELGKSKYQLFDEDEGLTWTKDFINTYSGDIDFHWERGGFLKEVSIEGGWEKRGIYNEDFTAAESGSQISTEVGVTLRPLSNFEWSISSDWTKQSVDRTGETVFDGMTYATALHLQVTRSLFLSTRLFGETREDQYSLDFLVGYYFGAGNIIQLSYKKSERKQGLLREGGHSITLKVSYLLRI